MIKDRLAGEIVDAISGDGNDLAATHRAHLLRQQLARR
jgi:hypothetical protein